MTFFGDLGSRGLSNVLPRQSKIVLLGYTFPMGYHVPKIDIICKS
jgi:hypothetical protein